jgi:hypothetical protein
LELVECVKEAHAAYPLKKINYLWLSLQAVMNKVIENLGDNQFKIPHLNKAKLEREGRLPTCVEVTPLAAGLLETWNGDDHDVGTTEADNFKEDIDSEPLPPCITGAQLNTLTEEN